MPSITTQNPADHKRPAVISHATLIHSATPRLLNTSGMFTPANSLADGLPEFRGQTPGGRPIDGAKHALGRLGFATHGAGTVTPGNTSNSVENLSRRIHNHLGFGSLSNQAPVAEGNGNRIVPSYERRFKVGLGDIDQRLAEADPTDRRHFPATPPTPPNPLAFGASPAYPRGGGGHSLLAGASVDRSRTNLPFPASFADKSKLDFTKESGAAADPLHRPPKLDVAGAIDPQKENMVPSPRMEASTDSDLLF